MGVPYSGWVSFCIPSVCLARHLPNQELISLEGFIIFPIQQLFLSEKTIKAKTFPTSTSIHDFRNFAGNDQQDQLFVAYLRSVLSSANLDDLQPNVWLTYPQDCSVAAESNSDSSLPLACFTGAGGVTLTSMQDTPYAYVAPLSTTFNSGLLRQFSPRMNSSASFDIVDTKDFPSDCDRLPGAFYTEYRSVPSESSNSSYILQACMPSNQSASLWTPIDPILLRQDLTEVLYLNISVSDSPRDARTNVFRVEMNSTEGYFELPNYFNDNTAGPLLGANASDICDKHCAQQSGLLS